MRILLTVFVSFLLLINGIGAIYGGYHLLLSPDGAHFQMSVSVLKHSPFHDFFIPGLILITANGLFSLIVLAAIIFGYKNKSRLVFAQGVILTGWIVIQVLLLQVFTELHLIYLIVGIFLIISSFALAKADAKNLNEKLI